MKNKTYKFLEGGGEMGALIRSFNWSNTPIGTVEDWPVALKLATSIMLSTPFPMYIAWGKEFIQLYNDGYRPILGSTKHPQALGISTSETFAEIWHIIESMFDGVMAGKAVGFPNFMLPLDRNGYVEECFFDFSYSPIGDENGHIGGVLVTVIEVTEQVKTVNALKQAKKELEISQVETEIQRDRLTRFFMEAPSGVCILGGPELIFELVNPAYQRLFPGRALLGKPVLEAVPEIKDQPIWNILQDVYHTDKTFEGKGLLIPLAASDQDPVLDRYFDFIYQPRRNAQGTVDGIMVFVYEVTEMVLNKLLVEESEKRFRSMVEQSPVPMVILKGEELIVEEINPPMLELIGRNESVRGKRLFDCVPELNGQPTMQQLQNTLLSGETWNGYEQPIVIHKYGTAIPGYYNISCKAWVEGGKITGVLQSAIDVTDQVNSRKMLEKTEDRLRLALLAAQLGTFDMDLVKGTMEWDERCRHLFGISHHDTVTYDKDFLPGLHPDDRDRIRNIIDKVLIKSISNGDYDVEYRTIGVEDRKVRWVRAMGKAYFDDMERPVRFIGSVLDITELKEDEIRKNDFIGMVSHELKTPLTSLNGYTQILQADATKSKDDFSAEVLSRVIIQVKKMTVLINGFLNTARLESGKIHLEKTDFDLDQLVRDTIEDSRLLIASHNIAFEPCEPVRVHADRDKIGSVISNLLSNATKYSPPGRKIEIRCEKTESYAVVSVMDEGVGISQQDIQKLFERYYRVESMERRHISGFGIGLYLSAEIINHHNGKIWVESVIGKGSTFYFSIPGVGEP